METALMAPPEGQTDMKTLNEGRSARLPVPVRLVIENVCGIVLRNPT